MLILVKFCLILYKTWVVTVPIKCFSLAVLSIANSLFSAVGPTFPGQLFCPISVPPDRARGRVFRIFGKSLMCARTRICCGLFPNCSFLAHNRSLDCKFSAEIFSSNSRRRDPADWTRFFHATGPE